MKRTRSMHTDAELDTYKEKSPFTFDEMEEIEAQKRWKRSYLFKPYEYMQGYRKHRAQNQPDYPYISFNGYEIMKLTAASKVLYRDTLSDTLYWAPKRSEHTRMQNAAKAVKTLEDKAYVLRDLDAFTRRYAYSLDDLGKSFLGMRDTDSRYGLLNTRYMTLNELVKVMHRETRNAYALEWLVEPEWMLLELEADAVLTQWISLDPWKAQESAILHVLRSEQPEAQLSEITALQEKYEEWLGVETNSWRFPVIPDVYIVEPAFEEPRTLKVIENGKVWAGKGQIESWLELIR